MHSVLDTFCTDHIRLLIIAKLQNSVPIKHEIEFNCECLVRFVPDMVGTMKLLFVRTVILTAHMYIKYYM